MTLRPGQQLPGAGVTGRELQHTAQAADLIEDGRDVDMLVGVDPQDDLAVLGHASPLPLRVFDGERGAGGGQDTHGAGATPLSGHGLLALQLHDVGAAASGRQINTKAEGCQS